LLLLAGEHRSPVDPVVARDEAQPVLPGRNDSIRDSAGSRPKELLFGSLEEDLEFVRERADQPILLLENGPCTKAIHARGKRDDLVE
jgi:hypothetical protein